MTKSWTFESDWVLIDGEGATLFFALVPDRWFLTWKNQAFEARFEIERVIPLPGVQIPEQLRADVNALARSLGPLCRCWPDPWNPPMSPGLMSTIATDLRTAIAVFSHHYANLWPGYMTVVTQVLFERSFSKFNGASRP